MNEHGALAEWCLAEED